MGRAIVGSFRLSLNPGMFTLIDGSFGSFGILSEGRGIAKVGSLSFSGNPGMLTLIDGKAGSFGTLSDGKGRSIVGSLKLQLLIQLYSQTHQGLAPWLRSPQQPGQDSHRLESWLCGQSRLYRRG